MTNKNTDTLIMVITAVFSLLVLASSLFWYFS